MLLLALMSIAVGQDEAGPRRPIMTDSSSLSEWCQPLDAETAIACLDRVLGPQDDRTFRSIRYDEVGGLMTEDLQFAMEAAWLGETSALSLDMAAKGFDRNPSLALLQTRWLRQHNCDETIEARLAYEQELDRLDQREEKLNRNPQASDDEITTYRVRRPTPPSPNCPSAEGRSSMQ